jgi:hypothetical protein
MPLNPSQVKDTANVRNPSQVLGPAQLRLKTNLSNGVQVVQMAEQSKTRLNGGQASTFCALLSHPLHKSASQPVNKLALQPVHRLAF